MAACPRLAHEVLRADDPGRSSPFPEVALELDACVAEELRHALRGAGFDLLDRPPSEGG